MAKTNAHKGRVSEHFSMIPSVNIKRSALPRSSGLKTTFDAGYLVPIFVDEVLPGDTFTMKMSAFCRMATPITPFMDNLYFDTFFFFVPNRLVWQHWENFNGQQDTLNASTDYLVPTVSSGSSGFAVQSIADYFGLPTGVPNISVNALPFRAYNLIYNEWFRDENLCEAVVENFGDGPDNLDSYVLKKRGKRHDYFTSALPWPQKGPGVEVTLTGNAPVYGVDSEGVILAAYGMGSVPNISTLQAGKYVSDDGVELAITNSSWNESIHPTGSVGIVPKSKGISSNVYADLTSISSVTINDLRQAFQIQKLYERDSRGGTRYTEILRSHFGVVSPDARLQRPEYLGGSSFRINVNPVAQTSATDSTTPQGNLSAFVVGSDIQKGFSKSFVEHGFIIGLANVRADLTYQQGINRMWSRQGRFDYYWPSLAHLGEQAILNKEIFAQGSDVDDQVFGYQERYAEYRYKPSLITGKMRSTDAQSLDVWHLAQQFDNLPTLNSDFIEENPPISRVIAVQDEPQFLLDAWFDMRCVRPMPVYSVPGFVDHF